MPVSAIVWNLYGRTLQKGGRYGNPLYWKIFSLFHVTLLPVLARDAVKRLGVRIWPTTAELDYQAGKSPQVPTGRLLGVNGRITRKIGYQGVSVYYERAS